MAKVPVKTADKGTSVFNSFIDRATAVFGLQNVRRFETRGKKPNPSWERAGLAVFGKIYREEVPKPKSQADVERLLTDWFCEEYEDGGPKETSTKSHAKLIWDEIKGR